MNRRTKQVASNIEHAVTEVLARGLSDPRIRGLITVTKVELTDDLLHARVYLTVMPEEREELTMHGLKAATGHIRREVMKKVRLGSMPSLSFVVDQGLKNERKILELLQQAKPKPTGWQSKPGTNNDDTNSPDTNDWNTSEQGEKS